jgi:hypothetical protein
MADSLPSKFQLKKIKEGRLSCRGPAGNKLIVTSANINKILYRSKARMGEPKPIHSGRALGKALLYLLVHNDGRMDGWAHPSNHPSFYP